MLCACESSLSLSDAGRNSTHILQTPQHACWHSLATAETHSQSNICVIREPHCSQKAMIIWTYHVASVAPSHIFRYGILSAGMMRASCISARAYNNMYHSVLGMQDTTVMASDWTSGPRILVHELCACSCIDIERCTKKTCLNKYITSWAVIGTRKHMLQYVKLTSTSGNFEYVFQSYVARFSAEQFREKLRLSLFARATCAR